MLTVGAVEVVGTDTGAGLDAEQRDGAPGMLLAGRTQNRSGAHWWTYTGLNGSLHVSPTAAYVVHVPRRQNCVLRHTEASAVHDGPATGAGVVGAREGDAVVGTIAGQPGGSGRPFATAAVQNEGGAQEYGMSEI